MWHSPNELWKHPIYLFCFCWHKSLIANSPHGPLLMFPLVIETTERVLTGPRYPRDLRSREILALRAYIIRRFAQRGPSVDPWSRPSSCDVHRIRLVCLTSTTCGWWKERWNFLPKPFVQNCAGEEKEVGKTENRQSCNSLSGSELKRKASMESFYSSSVSSTTFTSFPRHPDDSSLWPRVTQVLQMSRKEERGWWWKIVASHTGFENVFVVPLTSKKLLCCVTEIDKPFISLLLYWHIYQLFIRLNKCFLKSLKLFLEIFLML